MMNAIARRFMSSSAATPASRLIFFGAPGVGKGTYGARIAPLLNIPTISTGDILRAEIKAESPLGLEAKSFTDSGKLVPDEVVDKLVEHRLQESDAQAGFILDGYPRTVNQAKALVAYQEVDKVVNFQLKESVLLTKLLGRRVCASCGRGYNVADINDGDIVMAPLLPTTEGVCDGCGAEPLELVTRADDTEEVVRDRLRVYKEETAPVLDFFRERGVAVDFDVVKGLGDMPRLQQELGIEA